MIYDGFNVKLATKYIKSVKLSNFTEIYRLTNEKKNDIGNLIQKYLFCKHFVIWLQ